MNLKKLISILFFVLMASYSFAQKEANIWYFGNYAGLDFNNGAPIALVNSAMKSVLEGTAVISDDNGNLLFYTDGVTVWNKNHIIMPNGTGLMGRPTPTQSAVIVPQPGSSSIYYVFTVDHGSYAGINEGFRYSIIDMTLQGGLGDVTATKNVLLVKPTPEKVTAVKHCNGRDIWVITHKFDSKDFYAYLVTNSGLNTTPVISSVGTVHTGDPSKGSELGYLKASPNGSKLALACMISKIFEIFDFDKSTGIVSNPITLSGYQSAYGVEFSPDGTKLYGSCYRAIYQFNLLAGSPANIINSSVLVDSITTDAGALQVGPDKKIYVAGYGTSIGVINNPNALGVSCNYAPGSLYLGGNNCLLGLPNFIQSYFYSIDFLYQNICFGDSTAFYIIDTTDVDSILWNFGDLASGVLNNSSLQNPIHIFSSSNAYTVTLIVRRNGCLDSITKLITINPLPAVNLGNDTGICEGYSITFDAGVGFSTYLWQDGDTNQTYTTDTAGTYWVEVTDTNTCHNRDTINLIIFPDPIINLGKDTILCEDDTLVLDAENPGATYLWQNGSTNQILYANTVGTYWVEVTDTNGCIARDTTHILSVILNPTVYLGLDTVLCDGEQLMLDAENQIPGTINYLWQNGSVNSIYVVTDSGYYWVMVSNVCDTVTDTIHVGYKDCSSKIWIPNAFTPNDDGSNDVFEAKGSGITRFEIYIYNRWGELLFHSDNINESWNGHYEGTLCQDGVYAWIINYEGIETSPKTITGHVTLLH